MSDLATDLVIAEIWRYPIKSVGGERLGTAKVTDHGIVGDRGWGIRELDGGTVLTARRAPELLFASAAVEDGDEGSEVRITLPDRSVGSSADSDIDQRLSDWLGRPVTLVAAAGGEGGTYEVPLDFENDQNWVSWQGPGDAWHDSTKSRISLVSRDSLGEWNHARFRTNVILDGSGEDALVGAAARLGDAVELDVTKHIDRCVIVTRPQPGLERDLDVLRTINAERKSCLAIGALVTAVGTIAQGDKLSSG